MYNNKKTTIMFFQSIYQMMSAGTDLNINIRRTDGKTVRSGNAQAYNTQG